MQEAPRHYALAKSITDEATDDTPPIEDAKRDYEGKNPAADALGKLGGENGGKARAESMTTAQRSDGSKCGLSQGVRR